MHLRTIAVAGMGTAALVFAGLTSGVATASGPSHVSLLASGAASHSAGAAAAAKPTGVSKKGKCGSGFGPELPTPDGIISWNDASGTTFDNAGGADVLCAKATKIKKVQAYGYFGAASETFHVTFYNDSTTSGSSEPNDASVICDYPALTGAAGGQYPTHALTTLKLTKACKLPKGVSWVSIQNVDASGPWYWEMQDSTGGNTGPDWVDRHDAFGTGCTTFDNDRYLVDCLGYTYSDWMLKLG